MSWKVWLSFLPYFVVALLVVLAFKWANNQFRRRWPGGRAASGRGSESDPWSRVPQIDNIGRIRREAERVEPQFDLFTSRWSLDLLRALEWKRFELVAAAYFEALGFRARTARAGADGGVDIHLFKSESDRPSLIVQCKAWNKYNVGIKPVRELYGVMAREGVREGIFLTTGRFTQEAKNFPRGNEMHLWDGPEILKRIQALNEEKRKSLLQLATKGDFRTPTCPSCAIKMTLRASKKDGEQFWGCYNYPRCRQTFKLANQNASTSN